MNEDTNDAMLAAEWGESISAYVDGELTPDDALRVERLLAQSPAAARLAEELREMATVCQEAPAPEFPNDLSASVVAEALRRQAEGAVEPVDRLEPEGEFGLPFGKSSRNWMWAVFASAAVVMISFYGRPAQPTGGATLASRPTPQQIEQSLVAMQRVMPGMQVHQVRATPDRLARLQQLLAMQAAQSAQAPGALMAVSQNKGVVVEPAGPTLASMDADGESASEELIVVDADDAELDRLLGELDGEVVQVESDRTPPPEAPQTKPAPQASAAPTGIRGVWRLRLSPEAAAQLIAQQQAQQQAKPAAAGQRRLVVLRIQVKPRAN